MKNATNMNIAAGSENLGLGSGKFIARISPYDRIMIPGISSRIGKYQAFSWMRP